MLPKRLNTSNQTVPTGEVKFSMSQAIHERNMKVYRAAMKAIALESLIPQEKAAVPAAPNYVPEATATSTAASIANFTHAVDNPLQQDQADSARNDIEKIHDTGSDTIRTAEEGDTHEFNLAA